MSPSAKDLGEIVTLEQAEFTLLIQSVVIREKKD
jgi:hypothetical protein